MKQILVGLMSALMVMPFAGTALAQSGQSNLSSKQSWPSPVDDSESHGLLLADILEIGRQDGVNSLTWDIESWRGGDINRVWIKSEGERLLTSQVGGNADLQTLYGRLLTAYFDFQIGARFERRSERNETTDKLQAVVGIEGLALYMYELEALAFIGDGGDVSVRVTASQDYLFTQRAIAQLRIETSGGARADEKFGIGSGVRDLGLGFRIRYEIRRELAPYIGIGWNMLFGETADLSKRADGNTPDVATVAGLRAWY